MHIDKRRLYHLDWFLILNGAALLSVGMVNLISASQSIESGPYNLLIKQMLALVAGIGVITLILAQISDSCTIATTELYQARDEVGLGEAKWS